MPMSRLSGATSATTVKLAKRDLTWSSGVLTTVVETFSDGSVNTRTYTYDNTQVPPRLTRVVDTSPARTEDLTYNVDGTLKSVAVS